MVLAIYSKLVAFVDNQLDWLVQNFHLVVIENYYWHAFAMSKCHRLYYASDKGG